MQRDKGNLGSSGKIGEFSTNEKDELFFKTLLKTML